MCQAKPGPRCSAHQEQNLRRALENITVLESTGYSAIDEPKYIEAIENLHYNLVEWSATPVGKEFASARLFQTTDPDERRELIDQGWTANHLRESRINAVKEGTKPDEIKPFKATDDNVIRTLRTYAWYKAYFENEDKLAKDNSEKEKQYAEYEKQNFPLHIRRSAVIARKADLAKTSLVDDANHAVGAIKEMRLDKPWWETASDEDIAKLNPNEVIWKNRAAMRMKMLNELPKNIQEITGNKIKKEITKLAQEESLMEKYQGRHHSV
jgi:hypothetical protein